MKIQNKKDQKVYLVKDKMKKKNQTNHQFKHYKMKIKKYHITIKMM